MQKSNGGFLILVVLIMFLSACGGGHSRAAKGTAKEDTFQLAQSDSPYKAVVVDCLSMVNDQPKNTCRLSTLPFIGQIANAPTKADILAQTIVSHPWMATRFAQVLDQMPNDIFKLFRGVTGVVIGANIRPSHYTSDTGAIYLDPVDLWLDAEERATISKTADFRSDFGNDLIFRTVWRYVNGSQNAWNYYPLDGAISSRSIADIAQPIADLLFHELAHANDFMPPALLPTINTQLTAQAQINRNAADLISSDLTARAPLMSATQFALADVMFSGKTASTAQKMLTAEQVGLDFEPDGANDSYNYTSQYEDTAMLFEEVMMKYHFNIDREIAFTDAPSTANGPCSQYVVRWGMRSRVGNALVKSRAEIIVQQILGVNDASVYFANLALPRSLVKGVDWCNNLTSVSTNNNAQQKLSEQPIRPIDLIHLY